MEVTETTLPGVVRIEPPVFRDRRGSFRELWRRDAYSELGIPGDLVQDNAATSRRGVLRGLHYQHPQPQGKLVMVTEGEVFDVAVDVRRGSPHFGRWYGASLSAGNGHQLWIPEGFAHGYMALSEVAVVVYKCTRTYYPDGEGAVRWDDQELGIDWPVEEPILSAKDAAAPLLAEIPEDRLPVYGGD